MNLMKSRKPLSIAFAGVLLAAGLRLTAQDAAPPDQQSAPLLSPQQLDNLVAPIALYPDSLLSQVLVASTYPLEVTEAAHWLQQNSGLQSQQLTDAARGENWDASIQALVAFPDVLNRMSADIRWTTDLGNVFLAQQGDVMSAVQRMRARAREAGRLNSNAQQTVTTETQDGRTVIEIVPANPEVVYVPAYNPEYIWGPPVWGYYPSLWYPAGFGFYPGIHIGFFFGGIGWGGWGWWPNWFGFSICERPYFFSHCGYHGFVGYSYGRFGGYGVWAHDPVHRLGVAYPNRVVANHFAGYSRAGAVAGSHVYNAPQRGFKGANNFGSRANAGVNAHVNAPAARGAQTGNWSHFSQARPNETRPNVTRPNETRPNTAQSFQHTAPTYQRSTPTGANRGFSGTVPSYHSTPTYSDNRGYSGKVPSYHATPSYNGNRSYSAPAPSYHATPSYGGNRSYSAPAPSYRSIPSYGGSRSFSAPAPSYHSSPPMSTYGRSMPSYHASPSFSGGGSRASSASRGFSGGGGHTGGSSAFHGGGGSHVSGGGGHHR
jgi:uncharacterized membrane protein YgcG